MPSPIDSSRTYDIVLACDMRDGGTASAALAEEVRALAEAGFTVGLLHLSAAVGQQLRPFHAPVLGALRSEAARLLVGTRPVVARLLVLRELSGLSGSAEALDRVRDGHTLLVATSQAIEGDVGDLTAFSVQVRAERAGRVEWVPSDQAARQWLLLHASGVPVAEWDWSDLGAEQWHPGRHADGAAARALVRRLAGFIGAPSRSPLPPAPVADTAARVLFVSSNGAGVGHLTRLLSMARRAVDVQPIFFTLSQAVSIVRQLGFPCEHLPSAAYSRMPTRMWNKLFAERLADIVTNYRPAAVVFDGTWPYQGLPEVARRHPEIPFVWSRRGMWTQGRGDLAVLERARDFRLVVEPGELARDFDVGITAARREEALQVPPVVLLESDELASAEEARAHLGLAADRTAVLVTLGAGNINDVVSTVALVVEELVSRSGVEVCVTNPVIADRQASAGAGSVRVVSEYPLSRYLHAFDFAVSASGYNSFHELISFGVPTLFLPNRDTALDDQLARGRFAAHAGIGLCLEELDRTRLGQALDALGEPVRRAKLRARCAEVWPGNGAREAMRAVESLILEGARRTGTVPSGG